MIKLKQLPPCPSCGLCGLAWADHFSQLLSQSCLPSLSIFLLFGCGLQFGAILRILDHFRDRKSVKIWSIYVKEQRPRTASRPRGSPSTFLPDKRSSAAVMEVAAVVEVPDNDPRAIWWFLATQFRSNASRRTMKSVCRTGHMLTEVNLLIVQIFIET